MLLDIVTKGSTDRSVLLRIIDSTDGTPETGVVFNSSGIDLWYRREGAAKTSITEATLAALTTAHTDGGFLHVGDGYYRLDLPDAAFATGANYVDVGGAVTGMVIVGGRVRLVDFNIEAASTPQTGDAYARIGAPVGASTSADIAAIRSRLSTTVTKTGSVISDGGNSATAFKTDLAETTTDHYKDALIKITSGTLAEQVKKITAYNGTTKFVTVQGGFTAAPAAAVTFEILND